LQSSEVSVQMVTSAPVKRGVQDDYTAAPARKLILVKQFNKKDADNTYALHTASPQRGADVKAE
jgi:hypothetical protein